MKNKTEFVVAVPNDAVQFNEVHRNFTGLAGYFVANNIYNKLVVYGSKSRAVYPDLAQHWETLDGGRRFRFSLNQHARWHDGTPLTAHDVAYTHQHVLEKGYHGASFLAGVERVVELDRHTVEYTLSEPNTGFYTQLGNFVFTHIVAAHLYEGTDWNTNPHNLKPVGSGPFRFVDWVPGEKIVMEANPDHWGVPAGVDQITLVVVPDKEESIAMVMDGRAHYVVQDVASGNRLSEIEETEWGVPYREPGPGVSGFTVNHSKPLWQDRRVRQALGHAIDRDRLSGFATSGSARPYDQYLPETIDWAFDETARAPRFDLARAAELLDEAGITADATGHRMQLELKLLKGFAGHDALAGVVADCLSQVGITANVTALPAQEWVQVVGRDGDFDLIMLGGNMEPDPEITASRFETGGGRNFGRISEPKADAAYRAARSSVDRNERGAHYRTLQQVWAHEVSWVPLFRGEMTAVRSKNFYGWSDQVDSRVPYWHWGRIRPI